MYDRWYAVRFGFQPAVYTDAGVANAQVRHFPNSDLRVFYDEQSAHNYLKNVNTTWTSPKDMSLVVHTDGACQNNHNRDLARAGVGVFFGHYSPDNCSEALPGRVQTNQRAELYAIKRALELITRRGDPHLYTIKSDSQYAINCVTVWFHRWQQNGWKNSRGLDVENQDLIRKILQLLAELPRTKVEFEFVKGHSGDLGNSLADDLARKGVEQHLPIEHAYVLTLR